MKTRQLEEQQGQGGLVLRGNRLVEHHCVSSISPGVRQRYDGIGMSPYLPDSEKLQKAVGGGKRSCERAYNVRVSTVSKVM